MRLPAINTDQNATVMPIKVVSPVVVMIPVARKMQGELGK